MVEDLFVCNALVNLYAKCLRVTKAQTLFNLMPRRDVVSWNSLSVCYVNSGFPQQGLKVCNEMGQNGVKLNPVTMLSILPVCSDLQDLKLGKEIHEFVMRHSMVENLFVCNALVNLYAKYLYAISWNGVLTAYFTNKEYKKGLSLFSQISKDGVTTQQMKLHGMLSVVTDGCVENGRIEEAMEMFRKMQTMGFKPDEITISTFFLFEKMLLSRGKPDFVTFTCVLSACSHSRQVEEGVQIFNSMSREHRVEPDAKHYSCVVDIYNRVGRLDEA
ncbi:putative pentatricopeptide [Medicago truncatula]|uniref:Putative pentatricopeptide n=1 Tax=Medicago truncatula TaxID=3880 RepID=A0A396JDZ1_MEDTR|nr:putative pentatricopeptide [Medicago truncatula]